MIWAQKESLEHFLWDLLKALLLKVRNCNRSDFGFFFLLKQITAKTAEAICIHSSEAFISTDFFSFNFSGLFFPKFHFNNTLFSIVSVDTNISM